jgi:iron complex outermembrane receptor protein
MYQPWENTRVYTSFSKGLSDGVKRHGMHGNEEKGIEGNAFQTLEPIKSTIRAWIKTTVSKYVVYRSTI